MGTHFIKGHKSIPGKYLQDSPLIEFLLILVLIYRKPHDKLEFYHIFGRRVILNKGIYLINVQKLNGADNFTYLKLFNNFLDLRNLKNK